MSLSLADATGLIDPASFPHQAEDLDVDWLDEQVHWCRKIGGVVEEFTGGAGDVWAGIRDSYDAPEAGALYRAMDPVVDRGRHESNLWFIAAGKIGTYAEELEPLRGKLKVLTGEVETFRSQVNSGVWVTATDVEAGRVTLEPAELAGWYDGAQTGDRVPWAQHVPSAERNESLLAEARALFDQIENARLELERRLRELQDDGIGAPVGTGTPGRYDTSSAATDVSWFAPEDDWFENASHGEIREWWDSLDPWQQQLMITAVPLIIGNLNGIPLGVRAKANEINVRSEIARLEAEIQRLDERIAAPPVNGQSLGGWLAHIQGLQERRSQILAAIDSYSSYLELPKPRAVYGFNAEGVYDVVGFTTKGQVLTFDPAHDAIATYNGPLDKNGDIPDWIENIAIHVPGTTTKMESFDGTDERGYELYAASSAQDGAGPTAIITWAGGPLPQGLDAAWDGYSQNLGGQLTNFTAGIERPAGSMLTATGHSYGAAVVGKAEAAGLEADRVLYVSGAGLGNDARTIADFPNTGDKPHYTMIARNDLITGPWQNDQAGHLGHGPSSQDDPDATRLETGREVDDDPTSPTIEELSPPVLGPHSGVYTPGSTAFKNIIGVITGTEVELFAPDEAHVYKKVSAGEYWEMVDGIEHPDYEPDMVDISDLEGRSNQ
ncbi:alpha/beta hydrolase [Myceligenerans crystallogenes]|uniref:DUF1023 domain-containing protein n=1 Tax=Myceligenerans crystallogenes TaxID=316335 RepID=A0ABN2NB15_9MICO